MPVSASLRMRIVSALVLAPAAVAAAIAGGAVFAGLCLLAGVLMAWEWVGLFRNRSGSRRRDRADRLLTFWLGLFAALSAIAAYGGPDLLIWVWGAGVAGAVLLAMSLNKPAFIAGGILYAGVPIAALIVLRNDPAYGLAAIGWLFAVVWSTDIAAYFSGKAIGGPKLSPRWSPNKTWAGLGGGVIAAALAGLVTALLIGRTSVPVLMLFSGLLAIVAQIGDIFESALKRRAGIKDSSHIIPGHGGVMDRLDGLVSAAAVAVMVAAARGGEGFAAGVLLW